MKRNLILIGVVFGILIVSLVTAFGPQLSPPVLGSWSYCSSINKCGHGEGDCDGVGSYRHCLGGTICVRNVGLNYGWAPGVDVCECPSGKVWNTKSLQCIGEPCSKTDFDLDGDIDFNDDTFFVGCYGGQAQGDCNKADFDSDSDVDFNDLTFWIGCYPDSSLKNIEQPTVSGYYHPADTDNDWRISMSEANVYRSQNGVHWQSANSIWQNGEEYYWDISSNNWLIKSKDIYQGVLEMLKSAEGVGLNSSTQTCQSLCSEKKDKDCVFGMMLTSINDVSLTLPIGCELRPDRVDLDDYEISETEVTSNEIDTFCLCVSPN